MSRGRRIALASAYAAATFLAFPQPVAGRVIDLGLVLGWLAPALLLLAVRGLPPRTAAAVGFAASLAAHTALIHWIYVVTVVYGNAPVVVGLIAPALLACYCALFGGLFAAACAGLARARLDTPLALAAVWTALDHLRAWEFPWGTIGYVQHDNALLLPWATFGGVYALSFATVAVGAALAQLAAGAPDRRRGAAIAIGLVVLAHATGPLLPDPSPAGHGAKQSVRVAVAQGNIDQGVKWSRDWQDRTLRIYETLTRQAVAEGAEVVVWPETAVPGTLELNPDLSQRLERLAASTGATLVIGSVGLDLDRVGQPTAFYDSAFVFTPSGGKSDRYDKVKLVPFGEYVPLRPLIGLFVSSVASGATTLDVSAGERPRRMDLPVGDGDGGGSDAPVGPGDASGALRAGVVICYELLFPDLVRRFAADGAELMLAITNDAWYGRTGAPHQFLSMTALRSAETGLWTARAANTGVSGFIDGRGRVREATPVFERAYRVADVPLHPAPEDATFYTRHGDVLALACWVASVALLGLAWRRVRGADG